MKKYKLFGIALIAIILIGLLIHLTIEWRNNKRKLENLNTNIVWGVAVDLMDDYFSEHGTYPPKLADLWQNLDSNDSEFIKSNFKDIFSEEDSEFLLYCPVFTNTKDFIKGFYLISRGYDQQFNSDCQEIISEVKNDTYFDLFYNTVDINNENFNTFAPISLKIPILPFIENRKDLFVMYWDKLKYREEKCLFLEKNGNLNLDYMLNRILKYGQKASKKEQQPQEISKQEICLSLDSVAFEIFGDSLSFFYRGYKFMCKFYQNTKLDKNSIKAINGILTGLDKKNKKVFLKYCTAISKDNNSEQQN